MIVRSRVVGVLILAALAVLLCRAHVYSRFDEQRLKLVDAPRVADGPSAAFTFDAAAPALAVIVRAASNPPGRAAISMDGREICAPALSASLRRIDCQVDRMSGAAPHTLRIDAAGTLTIDALEIATHHGKATAPNVLFIVPPSSRHVPPSWWWTLLIAVGAGALAMVRTAPFRRPAAVVIAAVQGLAALLVLVTVLSPLVSRFTIIVSPGTAIRWLLLVLLGPTIALARLIWTVRRDDRGATLVLRASATGLLVAALFAAIFSAELARFGGNYSGFLKIARTQFDQNPLVKGNAAVRDSLLLSDSGYDGEFMYMMAFDPLLRGLPDIRDYGYVVDDPPFRYGRIGYVFATRILSAGDWRLYPAVMVWMVLAGIGAAAATLAWLAGRHGRSPSLGLVVLLMPGFWTSLLFGLPEPLAGAAFLAGIACLLERRLALAGLLCGASLLVRETGVYAVLAVVLWLLVQRRRRDALVLSCLSLAPIAAWRVYVGLRLYPAWGTSAFLHSPPTTVPFAGIAAAWRGIASGTYWADAPHMATSAIALPLLCALGGAMAAVIAVRRRSPLAAAACLYALTALSFDYDSIWIHVGNAERTSFELFVVLALVMATSAARWSRAERISFSAFWALCAGYVVWWAVEAETVRQTLTRVLFES
jgi:hypothetical protein